MSALQILLNTTDPQEGEPYTPLTPADAITVPYVANVGYWETWTGTIYPTEDSVPWQCGATLHVDDDDDDDVDDDDDGEFFDKPWI